MSKKKKLIVTKRLFKAAENTEHLKSIYKELTWTKSKRTQPRGLAY
ncbi:hypothetical protein [Porphyromonas sp. COT-290 OH3588]|nr:hypothetical protein [Porphyromonas sp. COT-290 OH3588]